jgi:hypothetical protein
MQQRPVHWLTSAEQLTRLMEATGLPEPNDKMPLDAGIKKELPDQKIR